MAVETLLTTEEVAELLRVPKQTIYAWRYNHGGPRAIAVGRHLRWRSKDIEAWLADRTDEAS